VITKTITKPAEKMVRMRAHHVCSSKSMKCMCGLPVLVPAIFLCGRRLSTAAHKGQMNNIASSPPINNIFVVNDYLPLVVVVVFTILLSYQEIAFRGILSQVRKCLEFLRTVLYLFWPVVDYLDALS